MNIKFRVELSQSERDQLDALLSGGRHATRKIKRAQILVAANDGLSDKVIAGTLKVSGSTIYRTKRRFVEANLEGALSEEPRPGAERKLSSKQEALLAATACSKPPPGRARWTLELLADEMVRLTDHEELSSETVRRRLPENHLKPWRKDMWCIPKVDGEYVARRPARPHPRHPTPWVGSRPYATTALATPSPHGRRACPVASEPPPGGRQLATLRDAANSSSACRRPTTGSSNSKPRWPSAKHFTSWLCLAPGNKISGSKVLSSRTRRSSSRAAALLRLAATTVGRSDTALGAFYRRLASRAGKSKAVTATARKIAVLFYNTLRHGMSYKDPGADQYEQHTAAAYSPT